MEFTLLGSVAIAVLVMYGILWFEGGRTNAADCTRDVWDALVSAAVVGVVIGRLTAMISAGTNPVAHPRDILIVRAGVDTIAASMSAVATYVVLTRKDPWWLADAAAPAAIAGLAGWHGGCVVRDACLGTPSDLPWAVAQAGSVVSRHPVEIYTALLLLVTVGLLVWWKRHRPRPGVIAAIAVAAAATARLITEPLRPGLGGNLVGWYSIAAVAALSVAALRLRRSSRRHPI
ncbi:MAG: prolipoprotein diacylglyceryl transferase family protein [Acidimicrobiia bacterium]